jgi:LEA14-like dessication related protein
MKRLVLGIVLGTVVGCSAIAKQAFREPSVTLRDVRVVGLGVNGGELEVDLSVYNPNHYQLDASRLRYRVFVGDSVGLAGGEMDARTSVQPTDSTIVRVPVVFAYSGLTAAARQLLMTGTVNYRVTGEVAVASGVGNFTVPFSTTGRYSTLRR